MLPILTSKLFSVDSPQHSQPWGASEKQINSLALSQRVSLPYWGSSFCLGQASGEKSRSKCEHWLFKSLRD